LTRDELKKRGIELMHVINDDSCEEDDYFQPRKRSKNEENLVLKEPFQMQKFPDGEESISNLTLSLAALMKEMVKQK
jgi:hypothetical protein